MADLRKQGFNPQPAIARVRTDDYAFQRQMEPAVDAVNKVADNPLLKSNPINSVTFKVATGEQESAQVRVLHKLGREYRGWQTTMVTRGDVRFFEVEGNSRKKTDLLLKARLDSVAGTDETIKINILVF